LLQEPGIDVIGPLTAIGLLHHHGDEIVHVSIAWIPHLASLRPQPIESLKSQTNIYVPGRMKRRRPTLHRSFGLLATAVADDRVGRPEQWMAVSEQRLALGAGKSLAIK